MKPAIDFPAYQLVRQVAPQVSPTQARGHFGAGETRRDIRSARSIALGVPSVAEIRAEHSFLPVPSEQDASASGQPGLRASSTSARRTVARRGNNEALRAHYSCYEQYLADVTTWTEMFRLTARSFSRFIRLLPAGREESMSWIAEQTLIHNGTSHPGGDFPTWAQWLARSGLNHVPPEQRLKINSTAAVVQAAIAARGVALVGKALVAQELESGRLAHLLPDQRWPGKLAYYMVAAPRALRRHEVSAFHDWLAGVPLAPAPVKES